MSDDDQPTWCSQAETDLDAALRQFTATKQAPLYLRTAYTAWLNDTPEPDEP